MQRRLDHRDYRTVINETRATANVTTAHSSWHKRMTTMTRDVLRQYICLLSPLKSHGIPSMQAVQLMLHLCVASVIPFHNPKEAIVQGPGQYRDDSQTETPPSRYASPTCLGVASIELEVYHYHKKPIHTLSVRL